MKCDPGKRGGKTRKAEASWNGDMSDRHIGQKADSHTRNDLDSHAGTGQPGNYFVCPWIHYLLEKIVF